MMLDQERLASAQLHPAPPCRGARGQSARLLSGRDNSKRGAQPEGLHGTFGMKTDDVAWAATQIVSYTCHAMFTTVHRLTASFNIRHGSRSPGPNHKPNFFDLGLSTTEPTDRYRDQTEFRAVEFGLGQSFDLCFYHTTNLAPISSMTRPSSSLHPSHPSHDLKTSTWSQPRARG